MGSTLLLVAAASRPATSVRHPAGSVSAARGRFARQFLVGLRCLVYESRWPGLDPAVVSLRERDQHMREEQRLVEGLVDQDDWVALAEHLRGLEGPTAAHLAEIAGEVARARGAASGARGHALGVVRCGLLPRR
jgi:hypothetical protein